MTGQNVWDTRARTINRCEDFFAGKMGQRLFFEKKLGGEEIFFENTFLLQHFDNQENQNQKKPFLNYVSSNDAGIFIGLLSIHKENTLKWFPYLYVSYF